MDSVPPTHLDPTALLPAKWVANPVRPDALSSGTAGASNHHNNNSSSLRSDASLRDDASLKEAKTNAASHTVNAITAVPSILCEVSSTTGTQSTTWSAQVWEAQDSGPDPAPAAETVAVTPTSAAAEQLLPPSDAHESLDSLSTSLTSSPHSVMPNSLTILYHPVLTRMPSDGNQRVVGETLPGCSVSSLSTNGSGTLMALAMKANSTPAAHSLEVMRTARAGGMLSPPEGSFHTAYNGGLSSPGYQQAKTQLRCGRTSPLTPLLQPPVSSSASSQKRLQQQWASLKLQVQQQHGAADLLAELNPSLLFMVQTLRHCRLSEVMCPVVVIGNYKVQAAATWAALVASWGNSHVSSPTSSPGLTAAPMHAASSACEPASGMPTSTSPHPLTAVTAHISGNHSYNSYHNNNDNHHNNKSTNNHITLSDSGTLPASTTSDQSGSHNTYSGALLDSITEFDGVSIDEEHAKARDVDRASQRDATMKAVDLAATSTISSQPPPSVANTVVGYSSSVTPVFDPIASGITCVTSTPSLSHLRKSAVQRIHQWPLIYANDAALGLLGYHKLPDVIAKEFGEVFRCFVYTAGNGIAEQQERLRKLDLSFNNESIDTSNNNASSTDIAAVISTSDHFTSKAAATGVSATTTPTKGRRSLSERPAPSTLLDELLRHIDPSSAGNESESQVAPVPPAGGEALSTSSAATPPRSTRLRELHNLDELFAPRYDNYVFLYSERTASCYAALAISSDQVELPQTNEINADPTAPEKRDVQLHPFDLSSKWKDPLCQTPHASASAAVSPPSPPVEASAQPPPKTDATCNPPKGTTDTPITTAPASAEKQTQQQPSSGRDSPSAATLLEKQAVHPSQETVPSARAAAAAGVVTASLAHYPPHAKYAVLYILQRIETGDKGQVHTRPPLPKLDEVGNASSAGTGSSQRQLSELFAPPLHPGVMDTAPLALSAKLIRPQLHSGVTALSEDTQDDVDAPGSLRRHHRHPLLVMQHNQPQPFLPAHRSNTDQASTKFLHGVGTVENTALVEVQCYSPRASGDWSSSNATHIDAAPASPALLTKERQQSSLFELSYTAFQADLAKPTPISVDSATDAFTAAALATASASSSSNSRVSPVNAAQCAPVLRDHHLSPHLRSFSGANFADHNATSLRARLGQMSNSLPLAPPTSLSSAELAPAIEAGSAPLSISHTVVTSSAGGTNTPQSRLSSPSELSHSMQSDSPLAPTVQPIVAPWRSIQEVRSVEAVAKLAQQVREAKQQRCHERGSTAFSSGSTNSPATSANTSPLLRQRFQQTNVTSNFPLHAESTPAPLERRGPRGSLGYSPIITTAEIPAAGLHSNNSPRRHSLMPTRVTGSLDSSSSRSRLQPLGGTPAMTWQRSNEVDQIPTKKLADRIRSQRSVVSVVTSTRLPETLIFNSIGFIFFVQQVLRFQQQQGVSQVVCILNVRSKTQLVVDVIPVDRLHDTDQNDFHSPELVPSAITQGNSGAEAPLSSPTATTAGSTPGVSWTRRESAGDHLSTLLRRRLAKLNVFYSEEESRQDYMPYSESGRSRHGSSNSVSLHTNEHRDHDSPQPSRTTLRSDSFAMSRSAEGLLKQDSSISSESRISAERSATPVAGAAVAACGAKAESTKIPSPEEPPTSRSTPPATSVNQVVAASQHSQQRRALRSHTHTHMTKLERNDAFLAEAGKQFGAPVAGGCKPRGTVELGAEVAAPAMSGSRNISRPNSARSGTHTPSSAREVSLASHPTIQLSSDSNTATTTATSIKAISTTGAAAARANMMLHHPHERPHHLMATRHPQEPGEGSPTTRNSVSFNNSNSRTQSNKSFSSWSAQWMKLQHMQPDNPSACHNLSLQRQRQCYPPQEWVPKSEYLPAETQQDLAMCDGDISISAHTLEAQVRIPFITPQRLELLSQLGTVQLTSYRGLSVFGVNLVNLVTEEAAAAAAQPSPSIIPLQYDMAARNYMKDAGEKSTMLPPLDDEDATKSDRLCPSGQRDESPAATATSSANGTEEGSAAAKGPMGEGRDMAATLSSAFLPSPESNARLPSPYALPTPGNGSFPSTSLVLPICVPSSPSIGTGPASAIVEGTPKAEDESGVSGCATHAGSSNRRSSGMDAETHALSSVSVYAPDQQQHQLPLSEETSEEQLGTQPSQQQQDQQQRLLKKQSTVIEKGSVVSVVMPPSETKVLAAALVGQQKQLQLSPPRAAADESGNAEAVHHAVDEAATKCNEGGAEADAAVAGSGAGPPNTSASIEPSQSSISVNTLRGRSGTSTAVISGVPKTEAKGMIMQYKVQQEPRGTTTAAAAAVIDAAPPPNEEDARTADSMSTAPLVMKGQRQSAGSQKEECAPTTKKEKGANNSTLMDRTQGSATLDEVHHPDRHHHHHHRHSSSDSRAAASYHSFSGAESLRDVQDSFFPEGLPRNGDWLVQTTEQSTNLMMVTQAGSPAASLPTDNTYEGSASSRFSPQHLSMSPSTLLPHLVSIRERRISPGAVHIDPHASPGSANSCTQGLVSVRTQKSGGTELLGYTLSNSAAAAFGGFSAALVKEATLDRDNGNGATAEMRKVAKSGLAEGNADMSSADNQAVTTAATAGYISPPRSPRARRDAPFGPKRYEDVPQATCSMAKQAVAAVATAPIHGCESPILMSHSPLPSTLNPTASTGITTSAVVAGGPLTSTSTSINVVVAPANTVSGSVAATVASSDVPLRNSAVTADSGRYGNGSFCNSNIALSPVSSGAVLEDTRQATGPREDANDSFAESFMDIFGLARHPQRLTELRRQVAERMRDHRVGSQSDIENSAVSTAYVNTSSDHSNTPTSAANANSSPNRVVAGHASSATLQQPLGQPEAMASAPSMLASSSSSSSNNNNPRVYHLGGSASTEAVDSDVALNGLQRERRAMDKEAMDQIMRHNLHVLVYAPCVYPEMEEVLGLYGHCVTFVTNPLKMLRYARAGLQPFDVLIVEWIDSLVTSEIHDALATHAVNETVVVYFISTKPEVHTPTMNVEHVMTDTTVVIHADDILTGLMSRNVLEEVQQLIRRHRLLKSMIHTRSKHSYQIVSRIGSGAFGDVFEVLMYVSKGKLAMKRIFLKSMKLRQLEVINREVSILCALDHPNIVSFSHTKLEDNAYSIFMELCDGNLADYLLQPSVAIPGVAKRRRHHDGQSNLVSPEEQSADDESNMMANASSKASSGSEADDEGRTHNSDGSHSFSGPTLTRPQDAVMIVHDIASALAYLHSHGIIHRDIKPANILFSNGMAKLGDFGSAVKMNESRKLRNMKGTMSYMAPEMVLGEPYTEACDLWSLGCLIASIMGIQLGHLSGLHMPALNKLYRSIPINGSLPLTCTNRLSSKCENHYTESTTNRVLAALKRALENEMEERARMSPPAAPRTPHSSLTFSTTSQESASLGSDVADEVPNEQHSLITDLDSSDIQNHQRSVMCIWTTSIDVLGEFTVRLPSSLVELFENLFHRDPSKRMTAAEILDHPVSWDVEWMTRMMNEVQMVYTQLSLSTMNAHASMNANRCIHCMSVTPSSSPPSQGWIGSPSSGMMSFLPGSSPLAGNCATGSGFGSSGCICSPNAMQPASGTSCFPTQSLSPAVEMGEANFMLGEGAGVHGRCSANDYLLDLSLSDGSEADSGEE
ncbi:putative protein kinase [Leptomonas seymouri]|uniref:non-specific serine/threonine protein kinase n=1 Tax=Leptomonas seymouri TaxID=5684 RepID=A0A0N1I6R6_LEPSE|nr:putative protein kinase [Leptomonas seymouri]|eukprot:KPI86701.1 putative protein kinase [Leptomonas seymouri]